jgi:Na+-transporting NADH:ubiquinone oxidoreductase subunit C
MQKDSILKTLVVAAVLCVVCSVLVSGAAVSLKERQDINKALDVKKNLLQASGLLAPGSASKEDIEAAYKSIEASVINLETGEVVEDMDPANFDQVKASKDPEMSKLIDSNEDVAGIKRRSKFAPAYKYIEDGKMKMLILPVNGKGLWSTLYGFLALDTDFQTVKGIGFYQHAETPGLGGEVDNPGWKAKWAGKKIYKEGEVELKVVKGQTSPDRADYDYEIDGLSGATITSNGVTGLVQYWMGEDGFGTYLEKLKSGDDVVATEHDHDSHHNDVDHAHEEHHEHNHGEHHEDKEHNHDDHDDHHNEGEHAHEEHHDHDHSKHHGEEGE